MAVLRASADPPGRLSVAGHPGAACRIPTDRRAGVDANVSNLALASFPAGSSRAAGRRPDHAAPTEQQQAATRAANRARARQRALDRSRRNTNADAVRALGAAAQPGRLRRAATAVASQADHQPGRASSVPALTECRCAPTATTRSRAGYRRHPLLITPPSPAATSQAKQARAREVAARIVTAHGNTITVEDAEHQRPGRGCGASGSPCSVPACSSRRVAAECAGRRRRSCTGPAPASTAMSQHCLCGQRVRQNPGPTHPPAARTAGCTPTATSSPRCWRACVELADPDDPRHRAGRLPTCPRPTGGAGLPARVGGLSQPAPATSTTTVLDRPGPAATTRWPLLSKQHSAHPRTDQATGLDVAGPAENNSPTSCLALHDPLRVNS